MRNDCQLSDALHTPIRMLVKVQEYSELKNLMGEDCYTLFHVQSSTPHQPRAPISASWRNESPRYRQMHFGTDNFKILHRQQSTHRCLDCPVRSTEMKKRTWRPPDSDGTSSQSAAQGLERITISLSVTPFVMTIRNVIRAIINQEGVQWYFLGSTGACQSLQGSRLKVFNHKIATDPRNCHPDGLI